MRRSPFKEFVVGGPEGVLAILLADGERVFCDADMLQTLSERYRDHPEAHLWKSIAKKLHVGTLVGQVPEFDYEPPVQPGNNPKQPPLPLGSGTEVEPQAEKFDTPKLKLITRGGPEGTVVIIELSGVEMLVDSEGLLDLARKHPQNPQAQFWIDVAKRIQERYFLIRPTSGF